MFGVLHCTHTGIKWDTDPGGTEYLPVRDGVIAVWPRQPLRRVIGRRKAEKNKNGKPITLSEACDQIINQNMIIFTISMYVT